MSFPSIDRPAVCIAVLALAASAACTPTPSIHESWTGPGWYLQKNNLIQYSGNSYFGGPWTYDKCEEERVKQPPETATQLICVRENRRPDRFGRS
jgi:hypothetical protein